MLRTLLCLIILFGFSWTASAQGDVEKGKYILHMGGCISCHKTPKMKNGDLSGGHALKSPFGTFYVPNITPDFETGIGDWSVDEFITAMTKGVAPDGSHYYPAFPYTSYTKMKREDLIDLKAYLDSVPAIKNAVPDHDLGFPFNQRILMLGWKMMFFDEGTYKEDPTKTTRWNRGAYIVNGPSHCGECHTPRNMLGGLDKSQMFTGNPKLDKEKVPSIMVKWNAQELSMALKIGMKPDGDFFSGSMGHVIGNTTSKLTPNDLSDVVEYLKGLE